MDFYTIREKPLKNGVIEIYPDFKVCRTKDLMVRAKNFYAIWDAEANMWSTDEYDVQRLVDNDLYKYGEEAKKRLDGNIVLKLMSDFSSNIWINFKKYMQNISDNSKQLDESITFLNTPISRNKYISKMLPYNLERGKHEAWDELIKTLYLKEERDKLEWAIGSIVSGDSRSIQKFIVLYGEAGSGKSTVLNIIEQIFDCYVATFDAKALSSNNASFSTEVFKSNPLVAIQHDGDLSKIEDNTKLNSIISHEKMVINEKFKPSYTSKVNAFLFMATNRPVKITDAKSGIIRRLIDVTPSGNKVASKRYQILMEQISFELGHIAQYCVDKYRKLGKNYYANYRPVDMMFKTDVFFNFVEDKYLEFKHEEGITLKQAYAMYKEYVDDTGIPYKLPMYQFREELKNYFGRFEEFVRIGNKTLRSYYTNFLDSKFLMHEEEKEIPYSLVLDSEISLLDDILKDCKAQYATKNEIPLKKWEEVTTQLEAINTKRLHYVKPPQNHIVIDFDLTNDCGEKDVEKNISSASKFPPTYAEFSKGGAGIHLHYIYDGDPNKLSRVYDEHIEIKVFTGNASLRRKLSKCNNIPINHINSGLPLKENKMINFDIVKNEKALRTVLIKNLKKEYHPGTKPSIDFIYKALEDAYSSGLKYDVKDLRPSIMAFANNSTNQSEYCIKLVGKMHFYSDEESNDNHIYKNEEPLVFYDVEVFPNLLLICWKYEGENNKVVRMFNPTPKEVSDLLKMKLVGFNCRRYDNHILYGRYLGYDNDRIYALSQNLISNSRNAGFMEAYKISYTDIYDYASTKQSLKKFEIEQGILHMELGLPWDEPVSEELWEKVADYCDNDVIATEATFNYTKNDFVARKVLAKLTGLTVNDTTQKLTAKYIFGDDKTPQKNFIYTDLSKEFPGYVYDHGKSTYKGRIVGEGGRVYSEPGMYSNIALLDVRSEHPTSLIYLNAFGDKYTKRYAEIVTARLAIKDKNFKDLDTLLNGELLSIINEDSSISYKDLAYALKIVINIVYGLTSAKFDNPFRDPRNIDNIVAKRGALFMIDLEDAVKEKGYVVAHIKTDSIKVPNADEYIINFIKDFGLKYGYTFEHEASYGKLCLVNDAVYIANTSWTPDGSHVGEWTATGAQFKHPYVFKTLFSKENIKFDDLCETKEVKSALVLDMNELLLENEHNYIFVGKIGRFCPIVVGEGGGVLYRTKDNKYYAATGTKGYRWLESEQVKLLNKESSIDMLYFTSLVDAAVKEISTYGDFDWFTS